MTDSLSPSRGNTPSAIPTERHLESTHAPSVPSPLNPAAASKATLKPVQREQREKKETLKKREASSVGRGATPDVKSKKQKGPSVPSPMRFSIPEPKLSDYEAPRDTMFVSHEPNPIFTPDGSTELRKAYDHAENKKAYRYSPCVADPLFHHKQYYRSSESRPHGPRMSIEDSDRWFHFDGSATIVTNEKGWRMSRANVFAREGSLYYEVKILNGVPAEGPVVPTGQEKIPQPHIRMGWARREAPLDAPVGFDGYSYGITDIRFETMHRSRAGKITLPQPKSKAKPKTKPGTNPPPVHENDHVRTGDVIGLLITLPSLSLHRKVIDGIYNPAVDVSDGFDDPPGPAADIIRDRIPVPFKGNIYFEQFEYQTTKPMEGYSDRGPFNKVTPHPNHEDVQLRSLPGSEIRVYKNGQLIGTAFEKLLAFLPPASLVPSGQGQGARSGFDDGALGYYPAVAAFSGGMAQVNFGPDFWFPPADLELNKKPEDVAMGGAASEAGATRERDEVVEKRRTRGIGERWKEQIAEDIVWDIIDEVDFYAQDGGPSYVPEKGSAGAAPMARGMDSRDE
jgi:COMPASS component BRE2